MTDRPQGWGQPHVDFAQALVQLARDHGVSSWEGSFRLGFDREHSQWSGDQVRISWQEGRHGTGSKISLRHESFASIDEKKPND